jgi:hypothetical protein
MVKPGIRAVLKRDPQPNYAVSGALLVAGAVALAATWNAVPWSWGFVAFYVGLAFLLESAVRLESFWTELTIQCGILGATPPFVFRWFFGEAWTDNTVAVHLAAIAMLSVAAGVALGQLLRPRVRPLRS